MKTWRPLVYWHISCVLSHEVWSKALILCVQYRSGTMHFFLHFLTKFFFSAIMILCQFLHTLFIFTTSLQYFETINETKMCVIKIHLYSQLYKIYKGNNLHAQLMKLSHIFSFRFVIKFISCIAWVLLLSRIIVFDFDRHCWKMWELADI